MLEPGAPRRWRIGPLELALGVTSTRIDVAAVSVGEALDDTLQVDQAVASDVFDDLDSARFARPRPGPVSLQLLPRVADRGVVVRPNHPLTVLPREVAVIYVSTPAWVAIRIEGDEAPFFETPTLRPSDTWFGATPQAGELCYATVTRARLSLEKLERRPARIVTSLRLENHTGAPWRIERLKVPLPNLSVHADAEHGLWTPLVRVDRLSEGEVGLALDAGPPEAVGPTVRLSEPRTYEAPHLLARALERLGW